MDFDLYCDMCEMYLENKKKQLEKTNIVKKKIILVLLWQSDLVWEIVTTCLTKC